MSMIEEWLGLSPEWWLAWFALAGLALLGGGIKGHFYGFRRHPFVLIGICVAFLFCVAVFDANMLMAALILAAFPIVCLVAFMFILFTMLFEREGPVAPIWLRTPCLVLGIVFLAGSFLGYKREAIATALYQRAAIAGTTSPLADKIAWKPRNWTVLGQLGPSPQKDKLIQMIQANSSPSDEFWKILLSLPPSPERLAVLEAFPHRGYHIDAWMFITLYDQDDKDGMAVIFEDLESSPFPGLLLRYVVPSKRVDVIYDLVRRGGAQLKDDRVLEAAIRTDNPEIVALLLDNGISRSTSRYGSPLAIAATDNRIAVTRLLLERGEDPNINCSSADAWM